MARQKRPNCRPYKLTLSQHDELLKRKAAGENVTELAIYFGVTPHTVYAYLRLSPADRRDAPRGRAKK